MKWMSFYCAIILAACSNKNDQKSTQNDKLAELRIHLEERLKAVDPASKMDSFKLVRIDTLTQRDKFSLLKEALEDSLDRIRLRMEVYAELYKANLKLADLSKRRSKTQDSAYKAEAEENKKELEKFEEESKKLELQSLVNDSLSRIIDTAKAIGYRAVCLYQMRRKDRSVLIDSGYILMNLKNDIFRQEDFIRLP